MRNILAFIVLLFSMITVYSQNNLIPNPGFENAKAGRMPQCDYYWGDPDFSDYNIDEDILNWQNGEQEFNLFGNNDYGSSAPDWHESGFYCTLQPFSNSRHLYIQEGVGSSLSGDEAYKDAAIAELISKMQANNNYIFKITYATGIRKDPNSPRNLIYRVEVHFSKFGKHWAANYGNIRLSFFMYPQAPSAGWVQHWSILNGPLINSSVLGNIFIDLNHIVLDCSQNHAYIDYVELAENCENPLLISNHTFTKLVQELPYKSGGYLRAGYNVGGLSGLGNVVVPSQADVTFKAATSILLLPGFIAEPNSTFKTVIEPCDINTAKVVEDTIEIIDDKTIKIGDITIYDDSRETLGCTDTLTINGLDGDTTSFINYFWDFGNGVTSTNPVGIVNYTVPGEYLVQLVLTDSSGVTDTLSKTYIRPDCNRLVNSNPNGGSDNGLNIYPNPTNGQFTVELESVGIASLVEVYDVMGKKVFTTTTLENSLQIDITNQPKGIYLLRIINGEHIFIEKIIYQ